MVRAIQKSNIRYSTVNMCESVKRHDINERLLGCERYGSLLVLLSTPKIQSAILAGMRVFSKRSSDFANGVICASLTHFKYADAIWSEDQARFTKILCACPQLACLRLGTAEIESILCLEMTDAIVGLRNLERCACFV